MSLSPEYIPPGPWERPPVDEYQQELATRFLAQQHPADNDGVDDLLARSLADETHRFFNDTMGLDIGNGRHSPIYRAAKAAEKKYRAGSCFAHTEGTAVTGEVLGLDMRIRYNGRHAANYWYAQNQIWYIDGQIKVAVRAYMSAAMRAQHLAADQASNGRMICTRDLSSDESDTEEFIYEPVTGSLGDLKIKEGWNLVLPVNEGIMMMAAMGDLARYKHLKRTDELAAYQEQMEALIPTWEKAAA